MAVALQSGVADALQILAARTPVKAPKPPTSEVGQEYASIKIGSEPEHAFYTDQDYVPDLLHPNDIAVYSQMVTDAQVWGLMAGITGPLHGYQWSIDPAGANEEDAAAQAKALGLPIYGAERGPRALVEAHAFNQTLASILLALRYRYFHFELVGGVTDGGNGKWTLQRLARRPPWTLAYDGIRATKQGDLLSIQQMLGMDDKPIPASQVAAFVWGEEEGGYLGRSMLRPLYTNWYLKKPLLKVDTINHELNGAGTAVATGAEGQETAGHKATMLAAANSMRAQPHQAVFIPHGTTLTRQGIQGAVTDPIASVRYHDEQMSKAMGQVIMDLAQTSNGSRALGDTLQERAQSAQDYIAEWVAAGFTTQVLQKVTAINYGPDAPCPVLRFDRDDDPSLSIADFALLVEKGVITPDPELEDATRAAHALPKRSTPSPAKIPAAAVVPPVTVAAAGVPPSLAERGMRRMLTEQEIRAGADFDEIDQAWRTALGSLLTKVRGAQAAQIEALATQVKNAAGDPVALANLTGVAYGADAISDALLKMAAQGVKQVTGEAKKQGVTLGAVEGDYADPLERRAQAAAQTLGNGLAQSASRKAQSLVGLSPDEVKTKTIEHLKSLTDAFLVDTLGGELTGAQNTGRRAAMAEFPAGTTFYASELLDGNTCGPCADVDGSEYATLDEAQGDYPGSAGFVGCDGGPRCRGTLVAVAPTEQEAVT